MVQNADLRLEVQDEPLENLISQLKRPRLFNDRNVEGNALRYDAHRSDAQWASYPSINSKPLKISFFK